MKTSISLYSLVAAACFCGMFRSVSATNLRPSLAHELNADNMDHGRILAASCPNSTGCDHDNPSYIRVCVNGDKTYCKDPNSSTVRKWFQKGTATCGACCRVEEVITGDPFGSVTYFSEGYSIPEGTYVVTYTDGCMKYGPNKSYPWTVHNSKVRAWYLLSGGDKGDEDDADAIILPGITNNDKSLSFEDCVKKGAGLSKRFYHSGGLLGMQVRDDKYGNNVEGPSGRSPTWTLSCLP